MRQWYLRITAYADRLLEGLSTVDFSDAMKEMQTNWIGKSSGAEIDFKVKSEKGKIETLRVYTTRPDTIFGVDFMVVAPELDLIGEIKSKEQTIAVDEYLAYVKSRSERERMAEPGKGWRTDPSTLPPLALTTAEASFSSAWPKA